MKEALIKGWKSVLLRLLEVKRRKEGESLEGNRYSAIIFVWMMFLLFLLISFVLTQINGQSNTWPIVVSREAGHNEISLGNNFKFATESKSIILQESLLRYEKLVKRFPSTGSLLSCIVYVNSDDETLDFEHLSESYRIDIDDNNKCSITAKSIYGAMHGLETFSQELVRKVNENENEATTNIMVPLRIIDEPVYDHRGLMLDTSRHYLSIDKIKQSVDAMVISKLNVLLRDSKNK